MSSVLTPPTSNVGLADIPSSAIWRLSVEQYHAMIDRDILHSGDPIELLEGVLVPKMTKNSPHAAAVRKLARLLMALVGTAFDVHTQDPITTADSEPEPDLSVVNHDEDDYGEGHPTADQTALVVEVAESSLSQDRGLKKRIYARAGIVEYWIVNLIDQQIEVYSNPTGPIDQPAYQQRLVFQPGESVPVKLGGVDLGAVAVSQVLPS